MAAILITFEIIHFGKICLAIGGKSIYGDKVVLLGISKRGNGYLRTLLIHGARSVLKNCQGKTDSLSRWLQALIERRGFNKAAVALANKNARILWVMATQNKRYEVRSADVVMS